MDKELINSHTKIKICGMTCEADIKAVNTYLPDYIGFVLFFPKSNRNISIEQAEHLLEKVDKKIRTVAVVVTPLSETNTVPSGTIGRSLFVFSREMVKSFKLRLFTPMIFGCIFKGM